MYFGFLSVYNEYIHIHREISTERKNKEKEGNTYSDTMIGVFCCFLQRHLFEDEEKTDDDDDHHETK